MSREEADLIWDIRHATDGDSVTHLRNTVTLSWVEMKPPVPFAALVDRGEGCFWHRFDAWCVAVWNLGHCDPPELSAGPVMAGRGGWLTGQKGCDGC